MSTTMPNQAAQLHRTREQPAPDPDDAPIDQIGFYLDRYRIKEALHVFYDEDTLRCLSEESDFMWDIIPLICKRLRGLNQFRFRVFEGCEKMLCRIAIDDNCSPKEVLISLLSEINPSSDDDNIFRAMIRPLEGALFRMRYPSPRCENLRWTLSVLLSHISNIDLPQEYNLEGQERLLISNDLSVKRFIEILPLLLGFVEDFIEQHQCKELSNILCHRALKCGQQKANTPNNELGDPEETFSDQVRKDCQFGPVKTILSLINYPLVYLDIFTSPEIRSIATRCLDTLVQLRSNIYSLIYSKKEQDDWIERLQESEEIGYFSNEDILLSLANTSYIHHCINLVVNENSNRIRFVPPVYTPEHTFIRHMPLILALLDKTECLVYEKGLALLEALLKSIPKESLDSSFIDILDDSLIEQQLFKIIVFSPFSSMRKFAFTLFTTLCDCLTQDCRYRLLKSIVKQTNMSAGVRGACVDLYRKYFVEARQAYLKEFAPQPSTTSSSSTTNEASCKIDTIDMKSSTFPPARRKMRTEQRYLALANSNLNEFLKVCAHACLPDAQQTDILEGYELISATLNFLRFLKLSEPVKIPVSIDPKDDFLSKRSTKDFLNTLRNAISLNMSDLKIQQKEITEKCIPKGDDTAAKQPELDVSLLSNLSGPSMQDSIFQNITSKYTKEQELDCIKVALCRLDLIQSIFVLTSDLLDS